LIFETYFLAEHIYFIVKLFHIFYLNPTLMRSRLMAQPFAYPSGCLINRKSQQENRPSRFARDTVNRYKLSK